MQLSTGFGPTLKVQHVQKYFAEEGETAELRSKTLRVN